MTEDQPKHLYLRIAKNGLRAKSQKKKIKMTTDANNFCPLKKAYKRPWRLFFIYCLILIQTLFFQNCGKLSALDDGEAGSGETKILEISQPLSLKFNGIYLQNTHIEKDASFDLNLETGELESLDSGARACVDSVLLSSVKALFEENPICHFPADQDSETQCISIFKPAYAVLVNGLGEEVFLGERSSGCSETTNFCNDNDQARQQLLIELMERAINESPLGECTESAA